VQGTVKKALDTITGEPVNLIGCGRTDAGVHAEKYCANFKTRSEIPLNRLPLALNAVLPADIVASDACQAPADFNAISSCIKKEYTYKIHNSRLRNPFYRSRAYFYPSPLQLDIMKEAAHAFVGTHDFAAVKNVGTNVKTTIRTIYYFELEKKDDIIELRICADGFLYNMARSIIGTVIYASLGKLSPEDIPRILQTGDRRLSGPTVPPHGLYMTGIWYEGVVGVMMGE
jgi:tRNA pseudouridine38-40 synthase